MRFYSRQSFIFLIAIFTLLITLESSVARAQDKINTPVFMRFKVIEPAGGRYTVTTGGFIHSGEPWVLPVTNTTVNGGEWSEWLDLSSYPWHGRLKRSGGIAEFPSLKLSATRLETGEVLKGSAFSVQLADKPSESNVVVSFEEKSG